METQHRGKKKGVGGRGGWVCFPLKIRNYKKWWGCPTAARGGAVRPLPGPPKLTCAQAHLCSSSQATEPVLPRGHHTVRVFRAFLSRRNQLSAVGFSTTAFLLPTLPENSRSKKKKKKPHFPYEVKQITPRTCALKSEPLSEAGFTQSDGRRKKAFVMSICCFVKNVVKDINKSDITSCSNVKQLS